MIRYTTPTHEHVVHGIDLSGYDVYVSYRQGSKTLNVKADAVSYDGTDSTVTVSLSQPQTGRFRAGKVRVQINWVTSDGKRNAVRPKDMDMDDNLMERVVAYGS